MTTIKERPILFSAPMVQAILSGTKTQTRRIVNPDRFYGFAHDDPRIARQCPYGQPGERLWVREMWQPIWATEDRPPHGMKSPEGWALGYPATDGMQEYMTEDGLSSACKPSIHMPRWASRINLEVTAIWAERLQDIGEKDAQAEGVESWLNSTGGAFVTYRRAYAALWDQINGEGAWASNPWVWGIKFRQVPA